ncbi:hypothetical protein OSB04_006356 [Centaurea solstitialis]|uniref:QWRF motif-containing protein 2 n=1 Tax=Centaurea solstitialis TaxID=347529 RepID=A0AA38TVK8_9ASTR|nr:hypothetical protein OSB04_006356 [Centaurea solstitialis]
MVVTISETTPQPSPPIRPKSRQVSSRYLSPSPTTSTSSNSNSNSKPTLTTTPTPSRRSPSPLVSRNSRNSTNAPPPKRSVSADRRRPAKPDLALKPNNAGEVSAATKLLVTSTRSLSVSFQGQAFSLPISKTKVTTPSPNLRKGTTPERKRPPTPLKGSLNLDHVENTKPATTDHHHRWPATIRPQSKSLSLNLDTRRASLDGCRSNLDLGSNSIDVLNAHRHNPDRNSVKDSYMVSSDHTASDTDSVSSGSTSGVQENGGLNRLRNGPRGIAVSAKFWQETNSRMRRLQDPGSPLSTSPGPKLITPPKPSNSKRFLSDGPLSSPRTMASPNRMRPSSPSKLMASSPSRGMVSPRRNSVSGISANFSETPSVLSFAVDVRRGKVGENRIFDAHLLRLLHNRQLQWRFVNARTEDIVLKQKHGVEENLWNAWITISDLRDSVTKKRHRLQLLRQKLKLASILKAQIIFLEDWAYLDKEHSISLLGAIEALKASTLRLPVGAGASADLQSMKDAISSALDVMQAMASSTHSLCLQVFSLPLVSSAYILPLLDPVLSCGRYWVCLVWMGLVYFMRCDLKTNWQQVEEVNLMVTELAKVSAKERALLRICKDFLSILSALKVKDSSLRTHMLQTNLVS